MEFIWCHRPKKSWENRNSQRMARFHNWSNKTRWSWRWVSWICDSGVMRHRNRYFFYFLVWWIQHCDAVNPILCSPQIEGFSNDVKWKSIERNPAEKRFISKIKEVILLPGTDLFKIGLAGVVPVPKKVGSWGQGMGSSPGFEGKNFGDVGSSPSRPHISIL